MLFHEVDSDNSGTVHVDEIVKFIGPEPLRVPREKQCEEIMQQFHSLNAQGIATCAYDRRPSPVKMSSPGTSLVSLDQTVPVSSVDSCGVMEVAELDPR